MRTVAYILIATLLGLGMCARGMAYSTTDSYLWGQGVSRNQLAGNCTTSWDDTNPFATPHTVVVSNDMPNGTVLFSWGYGEFIGGNGIALNCVASVNNDDFILKYADGTDYAVDTPSITSRMVYSADFGGIALKIYAQYTTNEVPCPKSRCYSTFKASYGNNMLDFGTHSGTPAFVEILNPSTMELDTADNIGPYLDNIFPTAYGQFQYRAELVKSGIISSDDSGKKVALSGSTVITNDPDPNRLNQTRFINPDTNITVVMDNCRLKTKDYTILMGDWNAHSTSGLPVSGNDVPVNLSLKCDGQIPHVRFRFEDAGNNPLASHNIRLYDAADDTKIDGLEIEMLYNGAHVDVDNTTLVDTGAHGTAGAIAAESTARFTSRYVQRAAIMKSDHSYTGPVTGKVNMWVTYD